MSEINPTVFKSINASLFPEEEEKGFLRSGSWSGWVNLSLRKIMSRLMRYSTKLLVCVAWAVIVCIMFGAWMSFLEVTSKFNSWRHCTSPRSGKVSTLSWFRKKRLQDALYSWSRPQKASMPLDWQVGMFAEGIEVVEEDSCKSWAPPRRGNRQWWTALCRVNVDQMLGVRDEVITISIWIGVSAVLRPVALVEVLCEAVYLWLQLQFSVKKCSVSLTCCNARYSWVSFQNVYDCSSFIIQALPPQIKYNFKPFLQTILKWLWAPPFGCKVLGGDSP